MTEVIIVQTAADRLVSELREQLAGKQSVIALGILNCILYETPAWKIIKEVREMIQDNYSMMDSMLGSHLTITIENFKDDDYFSDHTA